MEGTTTRVAHWSFPREIGFQHVHSYMERFRDMEHECVVFDLTGTEVMHSSFIGFMIHARSHMDKTGGEFFIHLSDTAERLLSMLNLLPFFTGDRRVAGKKSA